MCIRRFGTFHVVVWVHARASVGKKWNNVLTGRNSMIIIIIIYKGVHVAYLHFYCQRTRERRDISAAHLRDNYSSRAKFRASCVKFLVRCAIARIRSVKKIILSLVRAQSNNVFTASRIQYLFFSRYSTCTRDHGLRVKIIKINEECMSIEHAGGSIDLWSMIVIWARPKLSYFYCLQYEHCWAWEGSRAVRVEPTKNRLFSWSLTKYPLC